MNILQTDSILLCLLKNRLYVMISNCGKNKESGTWAAEECVTGAHGTINSVFEQISGLPSQSLSRFS